MTTILPTASRRNQQFVGRAVTWAAREGIRQFLDLGAGLPTAPSAHEMARAISPGARVVYVDNDPDVIFRARDVLAAVDGVAAVPGDLRDPAAILASEALTEIIDIGRPGTHSREQVAGFLAGLDLVVPGLSDARAWRAERAEAPAAGSVLVAVGRKPGFPPGS